MPEDSPSPIMSRRREALALLIFFTAAFVVIPIIRVTIDGGGNLASRRARWVALRSAIQSEDPGWLVVGDRERDIQQLSTFLYPRETALERAEAYFDKWRARSDWVVREGAIEGDIEMAPDRQTATINTRIVLQNVNEFEEYLFVSQWRKHEGIWYLEEENEIQRDKYTRPPATTIKP